MTCIPNYFAAFDHAELLRDYPVGQDFIDRYSRMSRDELRSIQEKRFKSCMARGWQIHFMHGTGVPRGSNRAISEVSEISRKFRLIRKRI